MKQPLPLDMDAFDFMVETMEKFTYVRMNPLERFAAFELLNALPRNTLIKDFLKAATPVSVAKLGLQAQVAVDLRQYVLHLERVPYSARWAALIDPKASTARATPTRAPRSSSLQPTASPA